MSESGKSTPSDEAQDACLDLLHGDGYTVLKSLVSPEDAASVRELLADRISGARVDGSDGVVSMRDLLSLSDVFTDMVTNERLLNVAHTLLGDDAGLGAFTAKILLPDCEAGGLHVDWPYWAMEYAMPVSPPLMMQVIWMMDAFTEENGGTWVAPGSQLWGGKPDPERFQANAIQATGEAGDAVVSHGLLWHQTAVNRSDRPRIAVLINYTQFAVRPMLSFGSFDEAFRSAAPPALATLLGFDQRESMLKRLAR